MADAGRLKRWRDELSGRDPVKFVNAISAVGQSGLPEGVELLENSGSQLAAQFWDKVIDLGDRELTVRAWRDEWLAKLKASLPHAFRASELDASLPVAFISYSSQDRARATRLAAALSQGERHRVFLDHWELGPGDKLRERLASSIGKAGTLVLLVSAASLASHWVKEEIELALRRAEEDQQFRIVPVLLEQVVLPVQLGDLVHVDWRADSDLDVVAQAVLDRIRGRPPFSARIGSRLAGEDEVENPYDEQHRRAGRALLPIVAAVTELAVEGNQQWLLWELFSRVCPEYPCTIKIGRIQGSSIARFELIDRWFASRNSVELADEDLDKGLWSIDIDPACSGRWAAKDMRFLGTTGRISFRSECRPRTKTNPIHVSKPERMMAVRDTLWTAMQACEEPDRQSFVYDLDSVVDPPGWRKIEIVVGGVHSSMTLAHSPMIAKSPDERNGGPGVTMELWDPFFGAMKSTELFRNQLAMEWAADVDLRSDEWETLLGLD